MQSALALFLFTSLCYVPKTSHVTSTNRHVTCKVTCAKGLVACYITLSMTNISKTCMAHIQNMFKNEKFNK